jgi:hypothetical protein
MIDLNPRQHLHELACRYAQAVDRRDWPLLASLLTVDARMAGPGFSFDNRAAIVAGMAVLDKYITTQHHIHNQLALVDGVRASVETYCVACHVYERSGSMRKLDWGLRYHDQCVLDEGTWRFSERKLIVDWTQDLPLNG